MRGERAGKGEPVAHPAQIVAGVRRRPQPLDLHPQARELVEEFGKDRVIDTDQAGSMEEKKKEGYF